MVSLARTVCFRGDRPVSFAFRRLTLAGGARWPARLCSCVVPIQLAGRAVALVLRLKRQTCCACFLLHPREHQHCVCIQGPRLTNAHCIVTDAGETLACSVPWAPLLWVGRGTQACVLTAQWPSCGGAAGGAHTASCLLCAAPSVLSVIRASVPSEKRLLSSTWLGQLRLKNSATNAPV